METHSPPKQRPNVRRIHYGSVRSQIETGDVLLYQGRASLSRAIRWATGSLYSHSGIAAWWGDRLFVFQSILNGVQLCPVSAAIDRYNGQVDWFAIRPEARAQLDCDRLLRQAQAVLTTPYSVNGLFVLGFRLLLGTYRGDPDPDKPPPSMFCSEFVSRCFQRAGLDLHPGVSDACTTPEDIARSPVLELRGVLHTAPDSAAEAAAGAVSGHDQGAPER